MWNIHLECPQCCRKFPRWPYVVKQKNLSTSLVNALPLYRSWNADNILIHWYPNILGSNLFINHEKCKQSIKIIIVFPSTKTLTLSTLILRLRPHVLGLINYADHYTYQYFILTSNLIGGLPVIQNKISQKNFHIFVLSRNVLQLRNGQCRPWWKG